MLTTLSSLLEFNSTSSYLFYGALLVLLYFLYFRCFNGVIFRCIGNYDVRGKNRGKTLPNYPNGWYVAIRSGKLLPGQSQSIDIAGENIVVFRSMTGKPYALQAYCKHLGANLGIGGKIINQKCIQCPFHGWLYDGQTGICVDYDGKPMNVLNVQYNQDFCEKGKKLNWIRKQGETTSLKKYPVCQLNGYVYVWIHAVEQYKQSPEYPMLDLSSALKGFQYRGTAIHYVKSHIQDIPENGADALHFKYVHAEILQHHDFINFSWKPRWKRGDDPDIKSMFEHPYKYIRDFKQKIYQKFVQPYPKKQFLSIGYIDNFVKIPLMAHKFFVNITIIQIGCSTVFIFLKGPFFTTILCHYLVPKQPYNVHVFHDAFAEKWLPYWVSALVIKMDAIQVASDMSMWDSKRFARNLYFRKGQEADQFLKGWREWYSQYYEGTKEKDKNRLDW